MQRCPGCKARLSGATQCPRCQADLGQAIAAEQCARFWLNQAIQAWQGNEIEHSLTALQRSLSLHKTTLALAFRGFIIQQQSRNILDLLAQKQRLPAKQQLYRARRLLPYSKDLQQLQAFTDYLLATKEIGVLHKRDDYSNFRFDAVP